MENSLLTEKLARRGLRVHQEYEVDVFHQVTVQNAMDVQPTLLEAKLTVSEVTRRLSSGEAGLAKHQAFLLTDENGGLAGIVTRADLVRAFGRDPGGKLTLLEAGSSQPEVTFPDETLSEALNRMLQNNYGRLPVVARENPKKIVGYLGRAAVLDARMRRQRCGRKFPENHLRPVVASGRRKGSLPMVAEFLSPSRYASGKRRT